MGAAAVKCALHFLATGDRIRAKVTLGGLSLCGHCARRSATAMAEGGDTALSLLRSAVEGYTP